MSAADINEYKNICEYNDNLRRRINASCEISSVLSVLQTMFDVNPVLERNSFYKGRIIWYDKTWKDGMRYMSGRWRVDSVFYTPLG
jgi:hypothetical protein